CSRRNSARSWDERSISTRADRSRRARTTSSESMLSAGSRRSMTRPDAKYLLDMLLSARLARDYLRGVSREAFDASDLLRAAAVRRLEIIGEAAARISADTLAIHPVIPWREIVGMRNRLVHEYFQVDTDVVWEVVQHD